MSRRPYDSRVSDRGYFVLLSATLVTFVLMTSYITMRVVFVITETEYSAADAVMAGLLVSAELFLCMHAVGYFFNLAKCARRQATLEPMMFARHVHVPVALLVAAFNEAEDVLDETLATVRAMDYPFNLYLLDDSTRPECQRGADAVAKKYGARLVRRTNRAGYKAGAINDLIPHLTEKYIALLDADQRPMTSWLAEVVPFMEEHPELALVQSPQHYINYDGLPVCEAAKYQQAMFYEYICEGKSHSRAMFCCGSNVLIRVEALLSLKKEVGGRTNYFDESSVTEDFATSFLLQLKGWATDYINHPYAVGMGPETLSAYFVQQMRWAMGTQGRAARIVRELFRNPRAMKPAQWWEYWMVSTYYFVGYANFIFMLAPIAFMLFDVKPVRTDGALYFAFFIPYVVCTMNLFYFGMRLRRYDARGIWLASALSMSTFWIYMKAGIVAIFGLKRAFGVTPKGVGGAIPLRRLWMEFSMFIGCAATSLWCMYHLFLDPGIAYAVNGIWATYHGIMLSTLFFHFNKPVTVAPRPPLFETTPAAA